jgi:hypothetical protein
VKRWRRAAAGVATEPHELRTPEALFRSIEYLSSARVLDRTLDTIDQPIRDVIGIVISKEANVPNMKLEPQQLLQDIYLYASEAVQQIGKDIIGQDLVCWEAIECREQMTRFYIMFMHELAEDPYWERESPTYGETARSRSRSLPCPSPHTSLSCVPGIHKHPPVTAAVCVCARARACVRVCARARAQR